MDDASLIGPAIKLVGQAGSMAASSRAGSFNKRASDVAARQRLIAGDVRAGQIGRAGRQVEGKQRAGIGAAGLVPSGTPEQIMLDSAMQADLEIQLARKGAQIEANALRTRGAIAQRVARGNVAAGIAKIGEIFSDKKVTTWLEDLWLKAKGDVVPGFVHSTPFRNEERDY